MPASIVSRMASRARAAGWLFVGQTAGAAAIEFAIVVPILILTMIGVVDFGVGYYRKMQVQDAAQIGAQYAMRHGFDTAAIQNAIANATSFTGITASPAPTEYCGCPSSSGVAAVSCTATCTGGTTPGTYMTVSAQGTYTTILPYPLIDSSFTFNAQSTVRMQ
jgi:Flp pilus assembly protein TadG